MTPAELKNVVGVLGMPAFTARQLAQWLYEKQVSSVDEMTNISKQNRQRIDEQYEVGLMAPIDCQRSKDGTINTFSPCVAQRVLIQNLPAPPASSKRFSYQTTTEPRCAYRVR